MSNIYKHLNVDIQDVDPNTWSIPTDRPQKNLLLRIFSNTNVSPPNCFTIGNNNEEISFAAYENSRARHSGDIGFFTMHDVVLRNTGYIFHDDHLLSHPGVMLPYVKGMIENGQRDDFIDSGPLVTREIEGPVAIITAEAPQIYGHWLLDYLPRLWLLRRYLRNTGVRIALPHLVPRWARDIMLDYFDMKLEDFVYFDQGADLVKIDHAIIPTFLHAAHEFHPIMNEFVADLVDRCTGTSDTSDTGERIYISRHLQRQSTLSRRRTLRNEDEIMKIAQDYDFNIICPEQLSWQDQIKIFSRARVVIGEEGSAMHNTLFSPPGSVIATVPQGNHVQFSLSSLRNHSITFLPAVDLSDANGEVYYRIDRARATEMFQEAIRRLGSGPNY
ncbi:glycosyltransferase family 61 protein [Methylobacterium ajmalii]|uniref:glycosyltransferase family 61 protein n=1 Tax=Methylobacterium ajmalii TaxID=2738439 RepID=UPI002F32A0D7